MAGSALQTIAPGQTRKLSVFESNLIYVMAAITCVVFVAVAYGIYIDRALLLYWFLGVVLAVSFLTVTGNPGRPRRGSPFGWAAASLAIIITIYFISRQPYYEKRLPMIDELSILDQAAAIVMIVLVLEATRRVIGVTLVVVVLVFLAYGVFGQWIEGPFSHRALSLQEMLDQLVFTTNGLFGSALNVAAFLVFVFVTFGAMLDRCGGGDFFFDLANSMVGRQVGGPAKVAVVSSGLYGSISGSPTADVVTTGAFTIPLMIRTGLSPVYAGAIEATASTGGALLPPVMGTAAFLMSDFTGIPYGTIAVAAIVPALLYYFAIFLAVHDRAKLDGLKPSAAADTPTFFTVVRRDWYFFVPVILLVWFVLAFDRPVYSAAIALASLMPIALWRLRDLRKLIATILDAFDDALRRMTGIGVACAVAGLVVGTLAMTDLTGKISSAMFTLAKGSQLLTLMIATVVVTRARHGHANAGGLCAFGGAGRLSATSARHPSAAGAFVHRLFRLDVGDHAAGRRRRLRSRLDRARQSDGDRAVVLPAGGGRFRHSVRVHLPRGPAADRLTGSNRDIDREREFGRGCVGERQRRLSVRGAIDTVARADAAGRRPADYDTDRAGSARWTAAARQRGLAMGGAARVSRPGEHSSLTMASSASLFGLC